MFVIVGSAVHEKAIKSFAGIAIGATVGLEAMFAGPICGASMNPARSFSPALISGHFEHLWLYIVATILGAVFAVWVNRYVR
jgi:aquaporin Z